MYVSQMLHSLADRNQPAAPKPAPAKRNTEKAREAKKAKVRQWFNENMKAEHWTTTQIASKRGQENSSCLSLLYDLEKEGFLERAGEGVRTGRGKYPIIWKLTNPPTEKENTDGLHHPN